MESGAREIARRAAELHGSRTDEQTSGNALEISVSVRLFPWMDRGELLQTAAGISRVQSKDNVGERSSNAIASLPQ